MDSDDLQRAIKYATKNQLVVIIFWDLFNHKKRDKLLEGIRKGKSWFAAYNEAKKL